MNTHVDHEEAAATIQASDSDLPSLPFLLLLLLPLPFGLYFFLEERRYLLSGLALVAVGLLGGWYGFNHWSRNPAIGLLWGWFPAAGCGLCCEYFARKRRW